MNLIIYSLKEALENEYINKIIEKYNVQEEQIKYENSDCIYVNETLLSNSELKLIKEKAESVVSNWLATDFKCTKNIDVENFLHKTSIRLQKHNLSRTFLIVDENMHIHAYFALTIRMFSNEVKESEENTFLSNTKLKKLQSYNIHQQDGNIKKIFWSILIGQLGRNDNSSKEIIDLELLLKFIFSIIIEIKERIGGNIVLLEAVKNEKLIAKYKEYNFSFLQDLEDYSQLFIWNETY